MNPTGGKNLLRGGESWNELYGGEDRKENHKGVCIVQRAAPKIRNEAASLNSLQKKSQCFSGGGGPLFLSELHSKFGKAGEFFFFCFGVVGFGNWGILCTHTIRSGSKKQTKGTNVQAKQRVYEETSGIGGLTGGGKTEDMEPWGILGGFGGKYRGGNNKEGKRFRKWRYYQGNRKRYKKKI